MKRRGVHSLVAVSILIGFAIVMAGLLLAVLTEYGDITMSSTECHMTYASLYRTGTNTAYLSVSVSNLGSEEITAIEITFSDDNGETYGFSDTVNILTGDTWEKMGTVPASVSDKEYVLRASVRTDDGSTTECHAVI